MGRRASVRRIAAAITAALVAVPLSMVSAAPAHAEEAWETALKAVVADTADWAKGGAEQVGLLKQPLPVLGVSPGALVDADHLVERASTKLASGLTVDEDLDANTHLTSTVTETNGDRLLDVTLTARHTESAQGLTVAGVTVAKAVTVTGWATLRLKVMRTAAGETFLVDDAVAPRIDIDAVAHLRPDLDKASASIGILGVAVTPGPADDPTALTATAHLRVDVTDPNHDGKLAFDTATGPDTGELAAPGSLAGLLQVGWDPSGGKTGDASAPLDDSATEGGAGHAQGKVHLGATAATGSLNLPSNLAATVTLDWPDISVGTPTVTTTGLDETIAKFRNMTPLDLASGLAQLATLLGGVQQSGPAGNLNLPFLRGTFADAVKINEKLVAFLDQNVNKLDASDPALAGQPKFSSIQELLKLLGDAGLPVSGLSFAGDKLAFTLELARTSTTEVALDPGAASVSGQDATYSATGFTLPANRFQPGALIGQRVVAGTSGGTILTNTANSITLDDAGWVGGTPAPGSPWVISSSDPHTGAVELGGVLTKAAGDKKVGLRTANAQASFATVKPSYTAKVTLVLDLQASVSDPADRVLLRTDPATPLFTADFPITSAIDFFTTAGFLKVKLGGQLTVGPAAAGAQMLSVTFKQAQDISLGQLFAQLKSNPTGLFEVASSVKTTGQVTVGVPGAAGPLATGATVAVSWTAGDPAPTVDTSALADLFSVDFNPDDPQAMFALVVSALQAISAALAAPGTGSGPLDQKLPLVGRSARQLLGADESGVGDGVSYADSTDGTTGDFTLVDSNRSDSPFTERLKGRTVVIGSQAFRVKDFVDATTLLIAGDEGTAKPADGSAYALRPELADAVDGLLAAPPPTLQDAIEQLNKVLGAGSGLTFALDNRAGGPYLRLGLDWQRGFHTAGPVNLGWDGVGGLVSLDSSGTLDVAVSGQANLGLLLPLSVGGTPLLDKSSSASVTVKAGATDIALGARVGPIGLDLGRTDDPGTVKANLKLALGGLAADGPVTDLLGVTPTLTTAGVDCGGNDPDTAFCASIPVFSNICTIPGDNTLSVSATTGLNVTGSFPDLSGCFTALSLTDMNVGIDGYLSKLEDALRLASFDGKLPLVGEDLQQGQRFIGDLREQIKAALGPTLANATGTSQDLENALESALDSIDPSIDATVTCQDGFAVPCQIDQVQSVRIQFTAVKGNPNASTGCDSADCATAEVPLDLGMPGLSLKAAPGDTNGITAKLGWQVQLALVLDRTAGFYVETGGSAPELQIGAQFNAGDIQAQLAFIAVTAQKQGSAPLAHAYFGIDIKGGADPNRLTLAELGDIGSRLDPALTLAVDIDWKLRATIDAGDEVGSVFPGISTEFTLAWTLSNHKGALTAGDLDIDFKNVTIDAGAFFSRILKPVLEKLKTVTGPLQPIIDTLYAPIPVLSDLAQAVGQPPVTLISLAKAFNTLGVLPSLDFIDTIRAIVDFVNKVPQCTGTNCGIDIGGFSVPPAAALTIPVSPATASSLISGTPSLDGAGIKSAIDGKATGAKVFTAAGGDKSNADKVGFTFPVFDNPSSLFGLLMGQDVELIGFDSGPLTLGFTWRQSFGPVYAPPPVFITLAGSASVSARIVAGLDTAGARHAYEAIANGAPLKVVSLLDGLYFKTADAAGNPVPVVTLHGEIAAGAEVSVLFLKAGVAGGVALTVGFHWNDPNNDGKFRTSEFLQRLLVNPICLFTTSGQLSVFLKVYITIDLFLFSKTFDFTLVNAVLLDFRAQPNCEPPPPELAGVAGDTLVVFAGKFGTGGQRGGGEVWDNTKATYAGDVFKIYALYFQDGNPSTFDGFAVEALGRRQEFLDPGLKRVVVDGRDYNPGADKTGISVVFLGDGDTSKTSPTPGGEQTKEFDKTAVVFGSEAPDRIKTGTGPSYIDGRGGDDVITTSEAPDTEVWVAGGAGKDSITTGRGKAVVAGDSTLGNASSPVTVHRQAGADLQLDVVNQPNTPPAEAPDDGDDDAADHITVGTGGNTVYGNDGDDVIGVLVKEGTPNGQNLLAGGDGGDTINGGTAKDKIYTYSTDAPSDKDSSGLGDTGKTNKVDTAGGPDEVYGSAGIDLVTSHSANGESSLIYGYGANDVLIGGYGTDQIFGGPGDDYVIAEPSDVGAEAGTDPYGPNRPVTHTPLPAGVSSQKKLLVGGLDSDHIIGGDGGATIFGDKYLPDEECADNDTFNQVDPQAQGSADLILGGAGVDVVSAGGGADRTDLGRDNDRACGQDGPDILGLGDGADKAWGGDDGDQIYGDAGDDLMFGNEGDDGLYGGANADTIEGNNGGDHAFGGPDNDIVYGGSRAAGATDLGTDYLYGEAGPDRLLGDNGTTGAGAVPYDLAGTDANAGAHDVISGGENDDVAFGGLGNDDIFGDEADDHLEGNNGSDTVHGNAGEDQVVGGSFQAASPGAGRPDTGDLLFGDDGTDALFGDNADVSYVAPADSARLLKQRGFQRGHAYTLLDLGLTPAAGTSGSDQLSGGAGNDVLFGQGGQDRVKGDGNDDYAEGGPGVDWVEGDLGDDDLVGGSSTVLSGSGETAAGQPDAADVLSGGPGDDVATGDNATVLRPLAGEQPTRATVRLGSGGDAMTGRIVGLLDRRNGAGDDGWRTAPPTDRYGADWVSGGDGVDTLWGQDGGDYLSGEGGADYLEGNGGADTMRGDRPLSEPSTETTVPPVVDPGWPGTPSPADLLTGPGSPAGQDDLIGGSAAPGFRDGADAIEGGAEDDVLLGDNGSLIRTLVEVGNQSAERVYAERYPTGAIPANATVARTHDPDLPGASTRFCTTAQATCEATGAWGGDSLFGDGGDDGMWGQDGNDAMYGGADDDDMYGELGDDTMYGNDGEDAMVGDRGGVVNQYLNAGDVAALSFTVTLSQVPQETYTGFRAGQYDRRVDLRHDVDGDAFVGSPTSAAMPHNGMDEGGADQMRGGAGNDNIHAGFGDDLANGDSGGDQVFGGDGADVLWGGKGCDPVLDASTPDCLAGGVFSEESRGTNDRFMDHVFGGVGATSGPSIAGALGSDVIDFNPRGAYPSNCAAGPWPASVGAATVDPCSWFLMTDKADDATPGGLANNQHHQGTDWIYGGWDRDVLQADRAQNGPNPGDRLLDWNGAYNLYTHCNASYGGFNDIRQHSPDLNGFLTKLAWGSGAGQTASDVTAPGTSAYRELAFVYTPDQRDHGSGSAFPTTPGHFDDPVSCSD